MAVFISSKVKGQTTDGYESVLAAVAESVKKEPRFIFHCAFPDSDGWQITEVWESKTAADKWFAKNVVPNLPPGIHPKRSYHMLHTVVTP